jgi:nicotinamide riboside kinase
MGGLLIPSELREGLTIRPDLHVAMLLRQNTTYSREQMRYLLLSAIRHRFVQALIDVLMAAAYACIY